MVDAIKFFFPVVIILWVLSGLLILEVSKSSWGIKHRNYNVILGWILGPLYIFIILGIWLINIFNLARRGKLKATTIQFGNDLKQLAISKFNSTKQWLLKDADF